MMAIMSNKPEDRREKRLRNLSELLKGIDRSNMELTMGQLSLEFYRQATMAEGYVHGGERERAEAHRLIAEAIHDILRTLEVKRREVVEAKIAPSVTDIQLIKEEEK
jgi:uncharacterized protein (DUF111 family)